MKFFKVLVMCLVLAGFAGCDNVETKEFGNCPSGDGCGDVGLMPDVLDHAGEQMPFSYSTTGIVVSVSTTTAPFGYTAKQLEGMADECSSLYDSVHFDNVVSQFSDTTRTIYNFKYTGESQASDSFVVTLLPNLGYHSYKEFILDFDLCSGGGDAYPRMMNTKWLLFVNACGTGHDDGSGRPNGCAQVRNVIDPSLKWNEEIISTP